MLLSVTTPGLLEEHRPPALEDIRLDAISEREWRVVDSRLQEHDAPCVLGFIEQTGAVFETLVIGNGLSRWEFTSLEEARRFFTRVTEGRR